MLLTLSIVGFIISFLSVLILVALRRKMEIKQSAISWCYIATILFAIDIILILVLK